MMFVPSFRSRKVGVWGTRPRRDGKCGSPRMFVVQGLFFLRTAYASTAMMMHAAMAMIT